MAKAVIVEKYDASGKSSAKDKFVAQILELFNEYDSNAPDAEFTIRTVIQKRNNGELAGGYEGPILVVEVV